MWEISKEFRFEAAHHLPDHAGKCHRPHGHSYRVRVVCAAASLQASGPERGMVVDYARIAEVVGPVVDRLDHRDLNVLLPDLYTTAENLAAWLFAELHPALPTLVAVELSETASTLVRYAPR